ncbi:MAG: hypothetical protein BJ554DRAFT_4341 [Olpidium bornovanus]|uniref:CH-like domain-containing protein n=1 Tax=Olpidium bornovanus TaxID=278681 RepID=A0A8H7ZMV2_9FUNG|nr:MAG: hypothetical protein BJ554DRAFT_4341 [Olpidium bornovanus]
MNKVNAAEIIKYFLPKLVDLHNYSPANATAQKVYNWRTLNREFFVAPKRRSGRARRNVWKPKPANTTTSHFAGHADKVFRRLSYSIGEDAGIRRGGPERAAETRTPPSGTRTLSGGYSVVRTDFPDSPVAQNPDRRVHHATQQRPWRRDVAGRVGTAAPL